MVQVEITQSDINSLADKLAALEPDLTPPERALLLVMLDAAAGAISQTEPTTEQAVPVVIEISESTPSIHDQFAGAFTPGAKRSAAGLIVSVGPGPVD